MAFSPTQYYVDPAIAADSGTGTIGDPFGDLQYALNNVTRDTTNGDQFNIKSGTAEVLSATLSFSTYGNGSAAAPIVLRGYTSAANDRGIAEVDGNGATSIMNDGVNLDHLWLIDIEFHNTTGACVLIADNCRVINCEVHNCDGGIFLADRGLVLGCYIYEYSPSAGGTAIDCRIGHIAYNLVRDAGSHVTNVIGIEVNASGVDMMYVHHNMLDIRGNGVGIQVNDRMAEVYHNSVYSPGSSGIGISGSGDAHGENGLIANNAVSGFATGIRLTETNRNLTLVAGNTVFDASTAAFNLGFVTWEQENVTASNQIFKLCCDDSSWPVRHQFFAPVNTDSMWTPFPSGRPGVRGAVQFPQQ